MLITPSLVSVSSMKNFKLLLLIAFFFGPLKPAFAGPYPGVVKDHGHTGPGDGGLITNLRVNSKVSVGSSTMTATGVTAPSFTSTGTISTTGLISASTITTSSFSVTTSINVGSSAMTTSTVTASTGAFTNLAWGANLNRVLPILQVQSYTTTTASSTANTSFTKTTLFGSITPKYTTSKIIVMAQGNGASGVGADCWGTLSRNGTNLGSAQGMTAWVNNNSDPTAMFTYDSPNTTSSVEYAVQIMGSGGIQCFFPITHSGVSTATLLLIEIGN